MGGAVGLVGSAVTRGVAVTDLDLVDSRLPVEGGHGGRRPGRRHVDPDVPGAQTPTEIDAADPLALSGTPTFTSRHAPPSSLTETVHSLIRAESSLLPKVPLSYAGDHSRWWIPW